MNKGRLYIVATPLGHLEDITLRALRVLREADLIAAEDTRHSRKLLERHGIEKRLISYHDHVEEKKAGELVRWILEGKSIALISDAGTPCIADPGFRLVRAAVEAGVQIEPVPGASSVIGALSVSGLPTDRFVFEGFVPPKEGARRKFFHGLANEPRTIVVFETARRLGKTLPVMLAELGDRQVVVAREMTKMHEEFLRGSIREVIAAIDARTADSQRLPGEVTLVVAGAPKRQVTWTDTEIDAALARLREEGMSLKDASRRLADATGVSKKEIYSRGLKGGRPE